MGRVALARRSWLVHLTAILAGLTAGGLVFAATASVAEAAPPVWPAAATEFTGVPSDANTAAGKQEVTLWSVACTGPGNCVAVGWYADANAAFPSPDQALVTSETNGVWGQASKLTLPSDANTTTGTPGAILKSVACTGPGDCVAVGDYVDTSGSYQAMVATETGGVWGQASKLTLPADEQTTAGRERAALSSVTCTSLGNCVAAGRYVSTASTQDAAMLATETGGVWGAGTAVTLPQDAFPPSHGGDSVLDSVACAAVGDCVALGYYLNSGSNSTGDYAGMAVTETAGVWGAATRLTASSDFTGYIINFNSVACQSVGNCVAVGDYSDTTGRNDYEAAVITETGGVWGQATSIVLPSDRSTTAANEISLLASVSCPPPGSDCVAVGSYEGQVVNDESMTVSESGGKWSQASTIAPPANSYPTPYDELEGVACTSPGTCVAVGDYADTSFGDEVMVLSSGPVPLSILTASLPSGVVGAEYTTTLAAAGGTGSDTWSVSSGKLPAGLSLNGSTGVISGTPTAAGNAGFTVSVTDSGSPAQNASAALSIGVSLPPRSVTSKPFGNQRITLTTPLVSGCVRNTAKLHVTFTSTKIPRSKATKLTFVSAGFYLDKGIRHVEHKTVRTSGGGKTAITVVVYIANATVDHVPASLSLSLKGLNAGIHMLSAVVSYTTIKKIHGHSRSALTTTTVRWKFRVC
jgi:Putative Ig domain